jgi:hypothetical protein
MAYSMDLVVPRHGGVRPRNTRAKRKCSTGHHGDEEVSGPIANKVLA